MALTPSDVGSPSETPYSSAVQYNPDQLIAGDLKNVTDGKALITGGLDLPRGTIMGKVTIGAINSAAKAGGNTGNGTNTLITAGTQTKPGIYRIRFLTATTFTVVDPQGEALPNGAALGAYANPGLNFTLTAGGTPFIAGDGFDITVAGGANSYKKSVPSAVDGSQNPCAVLVDLALASAGDVNGGVYYTGEFNSNVISFDNEWVALGGVSALKELLRPWSIFLKSAMSAAPPT